MAAKRRPKAARHRARAARAPRGSRAPEHDSARRGSSRRPDGREAAQDRGGAEAPARGTPRAFWSGTITFGLVSVPVDLFPAVRLQRVPLHMVGPDGRLLARRYYCSADEEPLESRDIVRGYERPDGGYTTVSAEELDALAPRKSRDIDLQRFVDRDEIPPQLLERPYVLVPAGDSTKAYRLLARTIEQTHRAGIATFVMRGREYLAAILSEHGLLLAVTLRFTDELRTPASIGLPPVPQVSAEDRRTIERTLSELKADEVDREQLTDEYAAALLELAERKREQGRDLLEVEEEPGADDSDSADIIDIMTVLKSRLGAGSERRPARPETSSGARKQSARPSEHGRPSQRKRRKR